MQILAYFIAWQYTIILGQVQVNILNEKVQDSVLQILKVKMGLVCDI